MVICNSPPFSLPSRECAEDYFDKTVEQLAEEMGQKVMSMIIIIDNYCDLLCENAKYLKNKLLSC